MRLTDEQYRAKLDGARLVMARVVAALERNMVATAEHHMRVGQELIHELVAHHDEENRPCS